MIIPRDVAQPTRGRAPAPSARTLFQMADHNSYETQEIKESAYMQQNNDTTVHQQLYTSSDDNVLDIVGDNHLSAKNKPILLSLYSESSKDADFASLWQKTSSILSSNPTPEIEIDFTGISFLYNKEFDYLEKIRSIITTPGGRLTIVHCDPEVVSLMNNHPNLIKIIEEKIL
jgi:hypothetical protein